MPDPYTIVLGNNEITNCDAALVIEGQEVFRLREDEDGTLMIDCDMRDQTGKRIAKIARSFVEYVADGFRAKIAPGQPAEVVDEQTGEIVARVERLGRRRIRVLGRFCVNGYAVDAREDGVYTSDGVALCGNTFVGWGTAIKLGRGATVLGCA